MKKTIIITGASSGLGRALAVEYSKHQNARIFLFGRNEQRLQEASTDCQRFCSDVEHRVAAVEDHDLMQQYIDEIANEHGIDIVIACAGVSAGTLDGLESATQVKKIFATNTDGLLNTVLPALPHMVQKKRGNIAIISSMAGLYGLSSSPAYSASKGAIRIFGEAIGAYVTKHNVKVSIVLPGFIATPMTKVNNFPMPFMMSPGQAAKKTIRGIAQDKSIIAYPLTMYFFMKLLNVLPNFIVKYFNSKLPGKPAFLEE